LADSYPIYYFEKHIEHFGRPRRAPRILDVGCGNGEKLAYVQRAGWATYGIDFSETAVASARAANVGQVVSGDGDRLPFESGYFDAVMSWHSLEHHFDPKASLREMFRVTRPGGYGILAVPTGNNRGLGLFKGNWGPLEAPRHLYHFTERTLTKCCESAGFKVVRCFNDFTFYGLFAEQEVLWSLRNLAAEWGLEFRFPRPRGLSMTRLPVLPFTYWLGRWWRGSNLIVHIRKPSNGAREAVRAGAF
jgi:SAM-dependent methyltransferase